MRKLSLLFHTPSMAHYSLPHVRIYFTVHRICHAFSSKSLSNFLILTPLKAADSTAQILESKTGLKKTLLEGEHSLGLNDCCWVDERLLVTASDDNSLVLWDIEVVIEGSISDSLQVYRIRTDI